MAQPSSPSWLVRFSAALSEGEAELALARALAILGELGLAPRSDEAERPWLVARHSGRELALVARGAEAEPEPELRDVIGNLLGSALARAAAEDERMRVQERLDMLSAASFEGLLVHVDGVVIDANPRLSEMLGWEPSEILGAETLRRCVAPEDLPGLMQRMATRYEGAYVITGVRKDGSRFRAELQSKQGHLGARPCASPPCAT
jgi:PAS domain S-box-containing protein